MFKIKFLEGTDTIKIGMTSQEIQKLVEEIPEKTTKGGVKNPVDIYSFCFIYFDDDGKCEGIEFFSNAEVQLNGILVFQKSAKEVMEILENLDPNLYIEDEDTFSSIKYSIGIYGVEGKVESIYVGREGCYLELCT